jgi:uncharacterized protein YbaA (DUF1428 family)
MVTSEKSVDSFVMPISKAQIDEYTTFAEKMAAIAKKHGAIASVNCRADDVKPGKETRIPRARIATAPTRPLWRMRLSRSWQKTYPWT